MAREFGWEDIGIGLLGMKLPGVTKGYYGAKDAQEAERVRQLKRTEAAMARSDLAGQSENFYGRAQEQLPSDQFGPAQPGTGLLGIQDLDPQRRIDIEQRKAALESENPFMQKAAIDMMSERQKQGFHKINDPGGKRFADKWLNLGNEYINPVTGETHQIRENPNYKTIDQGPFTTRLQTGEQFSKNLQQTQEQMGAGDYRVKKRNNFDKEIGASASAMDAIDTTVSKLTELSGITDWTSTGLASWAKSAPMLPPNEWMNMRDVIVSRLATDKMSELKALSPSGSTGFGALSERELDLLQSQLGSLSQERSPEKIKEQITEIMGLLSKSKKTMSRARDKQVSWYNRNLIDGYERYDGPQKEASAKPVGIPEAVLNEPDYESMTMDQLQAILDGGSP